VLVKLDVMERGDKKPLENPGADAFLKKMGGEKSGLPFMVFLDKNGKKLADSNVLPGGNNIGYPVASEEIKAFDNLLGKTAPRMTAAQRAQIAGYLKEKAARR